MYKMIIGLLFGLCLVSVSMATQLEGFNYATDGDIQAAWLVSGNDLAYGAATVYTSLSGQQEGSGAAKIVYNYSGKQYYEVAISKGFTTPLDLSDAKKFSFWINVEGDEASRDSVEWYIRFRTPDNYTWRYVDWSGLGAVGWKKIEISAAAMEPDRWVYGTWGAYQDNPIISQVTSISFLLQQKYNMAPGIATVYLDDLEYETADPSFGQIAVEQFNYADNSALQADWLVTIPVDTPGFVLTISTSDNKVEGSTAMRLDYHIVDYWRNVKAEKTLAQPVDFSVVSCFKMWVYGDYSIPTTQPLMMFNLQDVNTCNANARIRYSLKTSMWQCIWIQNKYALNTTASTVSPFFQDQWDAGGALGDLDPSQVQKIGLYTQGSRHYEEFSFTCYVDDIIAGFPITPFSVAAGSGTISIGASTPLSAADGIGPYTWSLSSTASVTSTAIGYIDGTSGSVVTFYSTETGGVDIYCWDSNIPATMLSAHVSVVPTAAPLYKDANSTRSVIISRKNWELF
ncbi:MAG: hypothetical protein ACE14V_12650 [bacterium]